jgi:PadR family transcriptional regulator PadR
MISSTWTSSEEDDRSNREARYYAVSKAGLKGLEQETQQWRQMAGVVDTLLTEEP